MKTTIYIVDDELMAIRYLKTLIKDCGNEYEVIGEATNGVKAIPEIARLQPDIVFVDISMPVMDGLQMAESVLKTKNPPVVFILTSHKDFDYVKKGIRLGVRDYILKNELSEMSVAKLLENTKAEMEIEKRDRHMILEHNIRNFLRSDSEVGEDLLYKTRPMQRYALIHILENQSISLVSGQKGMFSKVDCYEMNLIESPEGISCNAFVEMEDGAYVGVIFVHENCIDPERKLRQCAEKLLSQFQKNCKHQHGARVLISDMMGHFGLLQESYKRTKELLGYLYATPENSIILERQINLKKEVKTPFDQKLRQFADGLEHLQLQETLEFLYDISLGDSPSRTIAEYHNDMRSLYRILQEYIAKRKIGIDLSVLDRVFDSKQQLGNVLANLIKEMFEQLEERESQNYSSYVIEAIEYIRKNYDKDISIPDIAEAVGISEGHLRRLFKKELNTKVVSFLMDCRLEHAKKLMEQDNYSLDGIWKQTGFTSAQYFSYAFKQKENCSPREYLKNQMR